MRCFSFFRMVFTFFLILIIGIVIGCDSDTSDDDSPVGNAGDDGGIKPPSGIGTGDDSPWDDGERPGNAAGLDTDQDDDDLDEDLWTNFSEPVVYSLDRYPYHISLHDLDGDADIDVAISTRESIDLLFNDGLGRFSGHTPYMIIDIPGPTKFADFNGDGYVDIMTTMANPEQDMGFSIIFSNGDGTFREAVSVISGQGTVAGEPGDFDGDGDIDVAVINSGDAESLWVYLNNGNGSFTQPQQFFSGSSSVHLAAADYDGDSFIDMAVANHRNNPAISILANNNYGGFDLPTDYPAGTSPALILTEDLDDSGMPDLLVLSDGSVSIFTYLNNGFGVFGGRTRQLMPELPTGACFGDFDGDNAPDLAAACGNLILLRNYHDGTFGLRDTLSFEDNVEKIAAADLEGDSDVDLVFIDSSRPAFSVLYSQIANTTFYDQEIEPLIK